MRAAALAALVFGCAGAVGCDGGARDRPDGGATSATTGGASSSRASSTSASTGGAGGGGAVERPGTFVAVGVGGRRVRSRDDGVTWTDDVSLGDAGSDPALDLGALAFGRGLFAAAGLRLMTTPDGSTWHDTPPGAFGQDRIAQLAFGAGLFVGVGDDGARISSPDAVVWTQHAIDAVASHAPFGLAFGEGAGFVSINDDGVVTHSPDGQSWKPSDASISTHGCAVAFGAGRFVAVGGGSSILSTNGDYWSSHYPFPANGVRALVFAQGRFFALTFGSVYLTTLGDTWIERVAPSLSLDAAAYGHGTFVAFEGTRVRRSKDGVSWSDPLDLGGTSALTAVAFGPDA